MNLSPTSARDDTLSGTTAIGEFSPMLEWSAATTQFMIDLQRSPLQAGLTWQQSVSDLQKKTWSGWMGGRAPKATTTV